MMRRFIDAMRVPLVEVRLTTRSGEPFDVYRNPSREGFQSLVDRFKNLRGLLTPDGNTVYLWSAYAAIHTEVMDALGTGECDCLHYQWGKWLGPVYDYDGYKPAIERLTPYQRPDKQSDEDLLAKLFADDPHGLLD